MNLFACFDPFSSVDGIYGREIANHSFLNALIRYSSFDEFHFFLGSLYERDIFFDNKNYISANDKKRIKLFLRSDAKRLFLSNEYDIIFQPDIYIGDIILWRNIFAKYVPVCGITHSISYQRFLLEYIKYNIASEADGLIVTSSTALSVIESIFKRLELRQHPRLEVIPLAVEDRHRDKSIREKSIYSPDEFIFLSLGRISEYSKADLFPLLRVFKLLYDKYKKLRLIIAGSTSESNYVHILRMLIEKMGLTEVVRIYEDVTDDEKHTLYSIANCFISISDNLQETFGLTILEAGLYELPVIASRWDGYKTIIKDGETGILIDTVVDDNVWESLTKESSIMYESMLHFSFAQTTVVDPIQLYHAMEFIYKNQKNAREMGRKARSLAREYLWPKVVNLYQNFWNNLKSKIEQSQFVDSNIFWQIDYANDFATYPSNRISLKDVFNITEFGKDVLSGKIGLFLYSAHAEDMSVKVLKDILSMDFPVSVNDLLDKFGEYPKPVIMKHIVWLWKEFFIKKE